MHWDPADVAVATGGSIARPGRGHLSGIAIDSRTVGDGQLFVALRAERDGHDFLDDALGAGAGGVLVQTGRRPAGEGLVIEVADTSRALLDLGAAARSRLDADVIGITGSVGKTSTKDLVAAALAVERRVVASEKSFNNEIGVPLTLANAREDTEVAVIEMGARGPGHIALLCSVAHPTVAVVTAVAPAHTELFGDLEAIARAKGELVAALPSGGTAVLNHDDDRVRSMTSRSPFASHVLYSASGNATADVIAEGARLDSELRSRFTARTPWGAADVRLEARGLHQVGNALAALAVAGGLGIAVDEAASALGEARLSPWRMEISHTATGATLINDAYNSNPASLAAALDALAALPAKRRVAVLGEMAELGEDSAEEHLRMAGEVFARGVELVAVGTDAYGVVPVPDVVSAADALSRKRIGAGDAVLVKASRVAGLERLAELLTTAP